MTFYVMTSSTDTKWMLDVEQLQRALLASAPSVELLEHGASDTRWLAWRTAIHPQVELSIDRLGNVLYLRGPIEGVAAEALEFLKVLAPDSDAILFDEGYIASVDLRAASSIQAVVNAWTE